MKWIWDKKVRVKILSSIWHEFGTNLQQTLTKRLIEKSLAHLPQLDHNLTWAHFIWWPKNAPQGTMKAAKGEATGGWDSQRGLGNGMPFSPWPLRYYNALLLWVLRLTKKNQTHIWSADVLSKREREIPWGRRFAESKSFHICARENILKIDQFLERKY